MPEPFIKRALKRLLHYVRAPFSINKQKIICVGCNKTGTTSLTTAMRELGYHVSPQSRAELLLPAWKRNNYAEIVKFVKYNGVFFQDVPFSLPDTYKSLAMAFPNAKFILTIRDSDEVWYRSISSFHAKLFGKNGQPPTKEQLQSANYVYKGWMWDFMQAYNANDENPYDKERLKEHYNTYNAQVIEFFKTEPHRFLCINLRDADAPQRLSTFLGIKRVLKEMPWENKT